MQINVPANGPSHVVGQDGAEYMAKVHEGRLVIDVPPHVFRALLQSTQGKSWEDANQGNDAWEHMKPGAHF